MRALLSVAAVTLLSSATTAPPLVRVRLPAQTVLPAARFVQVRVEVRNDSSKALKLLTGRMWDRQNFLKIGYGPAPPGAPGIREESTSAAPDRDGDLGSVVWLSVSHPEPVLEPGETLETVVEMPLEEGDGPAGYRVVVLARAQEDWWTHTAHVTVERPAATPRGEKSGRWPLTAVLLLVPAACGMLLARAVLGEVGLASVVVGWALGLTVHIALVNALVHTMTLARATGGAIVLELVLGVYSWARCRRALLGDPAGRDGGRWIAAALALVAFVNALAWQLRFRDDDLFIHWPLMGLLVQGNFPLVNPQFPDIPYSGHYGKNLCVASLSLLVGGNFHDLQYWIVSLNHAAATLLLYLTARRYLGSAAAALAGVALALFGVDSELRPGLLDTFQNNNTFAYLLLFLNVHVTFQAIRRGGRAALTLAGLCLGTLALVYESHFGVFVVGILVAVAVGGMADDARAAFPRLASILAVASVLAVVQGGTLTEMAHRVLTRRTAQTESVVGLSQRVNVHFPKLPPRLTSYSGDEYSLLSRRLLVEAGPTVAALPLCLAVFLWRRAPLGVAFSAMGLAAIAVPATVDFGRYNPDVFRFLFLGAVCAAWSAGAALVLLVKRTAATSQAAAALAAVAGLGAAVVLSAPARRNLYVTLGTAWNHPALHYWRREAWATRARHPYLHYQPACRLADLQAAAVLRERALRGERAVTTFYDGSVPEMTLWREAVVASLSGVSVVGTGLSVGGGTFSMLRSQYQAASFGKRAFLSTGDVSLLDGLKPNYLVLDPLSVTGDVGAHLRADPRLELIREVGAGLDQRLVFAVRPDAAPAVPPAAIAVTSLDTRGRLRAGRVYPVAVEVSPLSGAVPSSVRLGYRLMSGGHWVNENDEVRQTVSLQPTREGTARGEITFAAPYSAGSYVVEVWQEGTRPVRLQDARGQPFQRTIAVEE